MLLVPCSALGIQRKACWATSGLTGSTDSLLRALRDMRPSPVPFESFDMGSLVELVQPLVPAEEADGARVRNGGDSSRANGRWVVKGAAWHKRVW